MRQRCLNPCYNGMTMELYQEMLLDEGCISLNPCYNGMTMEFVAGQTVNAGDTVLILVIME